MAARCIECHMFGLLTHVCGAQDQVLFLGLAAMQLWRLFLGLALMATGSLLLGALTAMMGQVIVGTRLFLGPTATGIG